jgi:RimJ/RimL family protein N-acetyltransferase
MLLELEDLTVRVLTVRDADLLVDATRAETGMAMWGARPVGPYAPDDALSALRAWDPELGGQTSFGILSAGQLVGAVGLMPDKPGSAELAYWVRPESRGQGIATRSVLAVTDWALAGDLDRVWLEINPSNTASLRVAERTGFTFEEHIPDHCRAWITDDPTQDSWHDCLIWARGAG